MSGALVAGIVNVRLGLHLLCDDAIMEEYRPVGDISCKTGPNGFAPSGSFDSRLCPSFELSWRQYRRSGARKKSVLR